MAGTLADMSESPDDPRHELRIGDADRERVARILGRHMSDGRLDMEEYEERLETVYAAVTRADLDPVLADMPELNERSIAPATASKAPVWAQLAFRLHLIVYLAVSALMVLIWVVAGAGAFWPIWPVVGWGIGVAVHGVVTRAVASGSLEG